jgi:hypothetical protein
MRNRRHGAQGTSNNLPSYSRNNRTNDQRATIS